MKMDIVYEWFEDKCYDIRQPFINMYDWVCFRTTRRYHVINTGLKPNYHDTDQRMLYGMFQLLVDYVEIECGWMYLSSFEENITESEKWYKKLPRILRGDRFPEYGIKYLEEPFEVDEDTTEDKLNYIKWQEDQNKEVLRLYKWWIEARPKRPCPREASGWLQFCNDIHKKYGTILIDNNKYTKEEHERSNAAGKASTKIEEQYFLEDQQMLIDLIHMRDFLWI